MSPPTAVLAKGRIVNRERSAAAVSVSLAYPTRYRMIALDSVFHSEKPYRSNVRVSIERSTESQLSRQR